MSLEDTVNEIKELARLVYDGRELVAGSKDEHREALRLKGIVEGYLGGRVRLIEIPVSSWIIKYLEIKGIKGNYAVAPYVLRAELDNEKLVEVRGDPSSPDTWLNLREKGIAVVKEPEDPDDLKAVVLLAAEAGFSGVIVANSKLRKIVTTGTWNYSFGVGAPTPIPLVYIDSLKGIGETVSLYIDSEVRPSRGYILEWDSGGSEDLILIGAHYDRWFSGFQDDVLGVVQTIVLAKRLLAAGRRVRLVLFSAEEHGTPGYAGWYWSWGSRFYSQQMIDSNVSNSVSLYVNFDIAGNSGLMVSGTQSYTHILSGLVKERCCECPECDSMQVAMVGIPTLSFHSLWSRETLDIYHTVNDTIENADLGYAAKAIELAYRAAINTPRWESIGYTLERLSRNVPLEGRRILYRLASIAYRVGWEKLYRELAARALRPVHYGSYRYDSARLEAVLLPELAILPRLVEDIRKGNPPHEIWIAGEERLIYSIKAVNGKSCSVHDVLEQAKYNIRRLDYLVDDMHSNLIK